MAKQQKKIKSARSPDIYKRCAKVAMVVNVFLPIFACLILTSVLVQSLVEKKNLHIIPNIIFFIVLFLIIIALTFLLYRYFPDALCFLFVFNIITTLLLLIVPAKQA